MSHTDLSDGDEGKVYIDSGTSGTCREGVDFALVLNRLNLVFECQKYERERIKMKEGIRTLGVQRNSIKELLGKTSMT